MISIEGYDFARRHLDTELPELSKEQVVQATRECHHREYVSTGVYLKIAGDAFLIEPAVSLGFGEKKFEMEHIE